MRQDPVGRFSVSARAALLRGALLRAALVVLALAVSLPLSPRPAAGQASVFDLQMRPFVVGIIPVVGRRGAVGGVEIDAQGVVSRTSIDGAGRLREVRERALAEIDAELLAASPLRKISLRALAAALAEQRRQGLPPTDAMQNLAGLSRVEYVLVDPAGRDIVLAGPAEGWQIGPEGHVVGRTRGQAVLQLDDLVVALRAARAQLKSGELITCSIDPTDEGIRRVLRLMKSRDTQPTPATIARLEEAAGPQQVTLGGIPAGSHFAHVLVAADFLMKRLGMNFEPAPIDGLPSYLELLQADAAPPPPSAMPRWWMAPRYEPLERDEGGLAWHLRGAGVQTLAEDARPGAGAPRAVRQKPDSLSKKWADAMTARYGELATKLPVFAELRGCMDLAVVGALFVKEDLPARAGCDLGLLMDEAGLAVAEYYVPKTFDPRASLVRKGRQWIVSVSGGVELDSWSVLEKTAVEPALTAIREGAIASRTKQWWWD